MKRIAFILIAASCLFLTGCPGNSLDDGKGQKEEQEKEEEEIVEEYDVSGQIINSKTKKGISGVPVTDGFTFVVTDASGNYKMKRNALATKIYYTTPEGYEINLDPTTHVPVFYSDGNMESGKEYVFNFSLTPLSADESHFTLIAVGDPQCAKDSHVSKFKNETLADITGTIGGLTDNNVYAITLGDIIYDSNDMWAPMKEAMGSVCVEGRYLPFFQCVGNHDHDGTVVTYDSMTQDMLEKVTTARFVDNYGPTDYSFDRKGVHFVVMDDVIVTAKGTTSNSNGTKWGTYACQLMPRQIEWLKTDLSLVQNKSSKTVVLCMHSDYSTAYSDVISAMSGFKDMYLISGHTHLARYTSTGKLNEHILSTACGMWWKTKSDVSGAQAGYNVYSFKDGQLENWYVKGSHYDKDYQMVLYDGSREYACTGTVTSPLNWYSSGQYVVDGSELLTYSPVKDCLIADVFASDGNNWTVELYRNGVKVGDFKRADAPMSNVCYAAYAYGNNKGKTNVIEDCGHRFWYYKPDVLPSAMAPGWEVVATQTIPGSGVKNVYKCSALSTDYPVF